MANENAERIKGIRNDYKKVFESEEGKRVLADLEKVCMFKSTTFDKEPGVMAFQEGLRGVYLHIITIMNLDVEALEKIASNQS